MVPVVLIKAGLDLLVAVGEFNRNPAAAAMFFGFFIADLGSAWLMLVST